MALTKEDLYSIGELLDIKLKKELCPIKEDIKELRTEVEAVKEDIKGVKEEICELRTEVEAVKEDIKGVKGEICELRTEVEAVKEDMKGVKEEICELRTEVETVKEDIKGVKEEICELRTEVEAVKEDVTSLKAGQARTNLIIENEIRPGINLLVENYVPAAKRYEKAVSQIEVMRVDIEILKKVVTNHSEKLQTVSG